MLGPSLTVMHLAIATVCTGLMIGLGFLARPQRSTVLWSSVFVVAMASAVVAMASAMTGSQLSSLISMALREGTPSMSRMTLQARFKSTAS